MEGGVEEGRGEEWAWAIGVEWRGRGERCTRGTGPEYFGFGALTGSGSPSCRDPKEWCMNNYGLKLRGLGGGQRG